MGRREEGRSPKYFNHVELHSGKGPYYKSKLELKSNSSEILPVNCKFICDLLQLKLTELKHEVLKSDFQRKKERYEHR